ncbi:MAG: cation-transporting P-type ATPase [Saprospiraceae bacterium]|nr:cation-transporting P-type ATPase [Saprospiraceae bacterium]
MQETFLKYYTLEASEVIKTLHTDAEQGLSAEEVSVRLLQYGKNVLAHRKDKSILLLWLQQLLNPIILILMGAGVLAFAFREVLEGIAIIVVILINSLIGVTMEWQARISMKALRDLSKTKSKVYRDGKRIEIDATEIVPGDILFLEAGDLVTADARVFQQHRLAIQESALTGESIYVEKQTQPLPEKTILAERLNSVFNGTIVTRGNGKAVVIATGNATELGKISILAEKAEKGTPPLDKRLSALGKKLIWLVLAISALIFPLGIAQGRNWLIMVETAIALAVAAIPEGLPVIATISLARGMLRLADKNVIVKSLNAVQTLGETNAIFADKTGTLTENLVFVDTLAFDEQILDIDSVSGNDLDQNINLRLLLKVGILCNDSTFYPHEEEKNSGDPLEVALFRMANHLNINYETVQKENPRIAEVPFDAHLKMMGTLHESDDRYLICVKGATHAVLEKCSRIQTKTEAQKIKNTEQWFRLEDQLAAQGLRILSFAYKFQDKKPDDVHFINDLTFLGMVGFIDPVRQDVKEAIQTCRKAGIKVVMLTGDHAATAANIAKEAGIIEDKEAAIIFHGKDLKLFEKLTEVEKEQLLKTKVFSRVNPSQKLDLVSIFQLNNYIVGMTGDGINDAPALKKADIGIAMGQRGTEAAKEVADMVLKDDAFPSIVVAIRQGRIIFENIRKFVIYLLSCNLSEIMVVGIAALLNLPAPLLPLQILFLNLVTDVFPALAIGLNEGESNIMDKSPRDPKEPIITKSLWAATFVYGGSITAGILGAEWYSLQILHLSPEVANNITFYTLILTQLWNVFNLPDRSVSFFKNEITRNTYVWYAVVFCIGLVAMVFTIAPAKNALALINFDPTYLLLILSFSLVPVGLVQLFKRGFKWVV